MFIMFQVTAIVLEATEIFLDAVHSAFLPLIHDDFIAFHLVFLWAFEVFRVACVYDGECHACFHQTPTYKNDQNHAMHPGYLQRAGQRHSLEG